MAERLKAAVSKTVHPQGWHRFKSCTLRYTAKAGFIMTIAICGSMKFHREMREVKKTLETMGHAALVPKSIELFDRDGFIHPTADEERIAAKIEHDFIREHFRKIEQSDAILVLNYDNKGIANYIGGNTFLEMGLAFWLGKKILLLHPIPEMDYKTEMHAMQPIVLHGDLKNIVK